MVMQEIETGYQEIDPESLALDTAETQEDIAALQEGINPKQRINEVMTCLPINKNGVLYPEFWRYYLEPWLPIFYEFHDPYNDMVRIWHGSRGGGKSISAVSTEIIDGQMKGIPVISNVPFAWVAKDSNGYLYKIESIPFDQERFAAGDEGLKYTRLFIDEGNYMADRLRANSTKNMSMVDIIQQARKFRMSVDFATINWMWLDSRITGSLLDTLIECKDLYYKGFGRRQGLKKGHRIAWDVIDQSGKTTGQQFTKIGSYTFNARFMWHTYNTENFVDPREARKKLKGQEKTLVDESGNIVPVTAWLSDLRNRLHSMALSQDTWNSNELFNTLGIHDQGLRIKAGQYMRGSLGIEKYKHNNGASSYDLSELLV